MWLRACDSRRRSTRWRLSADFAIICHRHPPPTGAAGSAGAARGSGASGAGTSASASPFWTNNNAKTESSYTFNVVTTMEISSSKNSSDKAILKMHYNTKEAYPGTLMMSADPKKQQQGSALIVLDAKNQAMVMLMASDKSKFSIAYGWADAQIPHGDDGRNR